MLTAQQVEVRAGDFNHSHFVAGLLGAVHVRARECVTVVAPVGIRMALDDHDSPSLHQLTPAIRVSF